MAWTYRYVTTTGTGSWADSTNINTPCSLATMVANLAGGDYAYVKEGVYNLSSDLAITTGGSYTTGSAVIEGYKATPGDGDLGRLVNTTGLNDTTNFPVFLFDNAHSFNNTTAVILRNIHLKSSRGSSGYTLQAPGLYSQFIHCTIENTASGGRAAIDDTNGTAFLDCDFIAVDDIALYSRGNVYGCYFKTTGVGLFCASAGAVIAHNVFENCSFGIDFYTSRSYSIIAANNTFYNCTSADIYWHSNQQCYGLGPVIAQNMATDSGQFVRMYTSGAYGGLATCIKNRTRDNASDDAARAQCPIGGDAWAPITTDTGGPATDYNNYSVGDFRPLRASPGSRAGSAGMDCGALITCWNPTSAQTLNSYTGPGGLGSVELKDLTYAEEAARNLDIGVSNARKGAAYKHLNVEKEGMLAGCIDADGVNQGASGTLDASSVFHATGIIDESAVYHASGVCQSGGVVYADTGLESADVEDETPWHDADGDFAGELEIKDLTYEEEANRNTFADADLAKLAEDVSFRSKNVEKTGTLPNAKIVKSSGLPLSDWDDSNILSQGDATNNFKDQLSIGNDWTGGLSGGGSPPDVPDFTVSADELEITFTFSNSTAGVTNTVYAAEFGSEDWEEIGSRSGDGTVVVDMDAGFYWAIGVSSNNNGDATTFPKDFSATLTGTLYPVSAAIKDVLVEYGFGTFATDLFVASMPDTPDDCVSVHDRGTDTLDRDIETGEVYEKKLAQIRVRSLAYLTGYRKLRAIHEVMDAIVDIEGPDGLIYGAARREQEMLYVGQDERKRFLFTANYTLTVRKE